MICRLCDLQQMACCKEVLLGSFSRDPAWYAANRLPLFRRWLKGEVGIVSIHNALPLSIRLPLPDFDELACIAERRTSLGILHGVLVGPVDVTEFAGLRYFDFGSLP